MRMLAFSPLHAQAQGHPRNMLECFLWPFSVDSQVYACMCTLFLLILN